MEWQRLAWVQYHPKAKLETNQKSHLDHHEHPWKGLEIYFSIWKMIFVKNVTMAIFEGGIKTRSPNPFNLNFNLFCMKKVFYKYSMCITALRGGNTKFIKCL